LPRWQSQRTFFNFLNSVSNPILTDEATGAQQSVPAGVFRGDSKATVFLSPTSLSSHNACCHFMKETTFTFSTSSRHLD
jgi:hypothetical protein